MTPSGLLLNDDAAATLAPSTKPTDPASRRCRALQIGQHWFGETPGGLDRIFHALVTHLPNVGVDIRGLVSGSPHVAVQSAGKVEAFAPTAASLLTRMVNARRFIHARIQSFRPDIVATHCALYAVPTLGLIGTSEERPRIMHFHGPWADESAVEGGTALSVFTKRAIEHLAYARQTRYIVLSHAFAGILSTRYRVPPEKIRVVPGCVDIEAFALPISRRHAREQLQLPSDRPIILSVRRLTRRMGLENLIDAMTQIVQAIPDALLIIVGRGPLAEELNARIVARSMQRHIRLLGTISDAHLPLTYRAADLSVVPTTALEGFGLTTVESLAAGTPVMVTPVGGLPETVAHLSDALVFSDCSDNAIASGIIEALLGRSPLPSEAQCRRHVQERFSAPLMAEKVAQVYDETLEKGSS